MPAALARILGSDTKPTTPSEHQKAFFENATTTPPDCICQNLQAPGENPQCPAHPWWQRDPLVLQLADHPDGPWTAALQTFGGASELR